MHPLKIMTHILKIIMHRLKIIMGLRKINHAPLENNPAGAYGHVLISLEIRWIQKILLTYTRERDS